MKKGIISISIVLIILVSTVLFIYFNAVNPIQLSEEKAIKIAKAEAPITVVDDFYQYNGTESFYVVQGKNNKGASIIVWISEEDGKTIYKNASDGITRQQAVNKAMEEIGSNEIIYVKLGMENGIPLWEIHSRSNDNQLNYHSLSFQTGEWLKKIENL